MSVVPNEYYYHFKHDPVKGVFDMAYQVIGLSVHTETEELMVIYKPLYDCDYIKEKGAQSFVRPLDMFIEEVATDSYTGTRFTKIEDESVIATLAKNNL